MPARPRPPRLIEESRSRPASMGASEMFVEGFLELYHAGILRREVEGALLHAAFFVGSRAFYRELREMPRGRPREVPHDGGVLRQRDLRR